MCIKELYEKGTNLFQKMEDVPLLLLRVILAYTFFAPGMMKMNDIASTAGFFEYLGIPFPTLNAYLAGGIEVVGAILLALGLLTRFISVPLLFVMIIAIATVHGAHGFNVILPDSGWENPFINGEEIKGTVVVLQNGYEMVLYYMSMLMVLIGKGAGRLSLDFLIFKRP